MFEEQETNARLFEKTGLFLDQPDKMKHAKVLCKRSTINILQLLYSRIGTNGSSWWSVGGIRERTHDTTKRIQETLNHLTILGLADKIRIDNVKSYSIIKKPFLGIIPIFEKPEKPRQYVGTQFCYKINADYIELVINPEGDRTIFVPAENMHLKNLELFKLLFQDRTMIILQAMAKMNRPVHTNEIQQYLNSLYNPAVNTKEYNLKNIRNLTTLAFIDNIAAKISTNLENYTSGYTIINRDTLQKDGKNISMLYSLNFNRVRISFTNKIGSEFRKKNNTFEFHFPNPEDIRSSDQKLVDDILNQGIIINIE